jgi:hypothetical protein
MNRTAVPHVEMLSRDDQMSFQILHHSLSARENRYNRHRRLVTLKTLLFGILSFCNRGDEDDSLRCFVCGLLWVEPLTLAVNTRQLSCLLRKSKSSLNGALAMMNWAPYPMTWETNEKLRQAMPILRQHPDNLRQWTIRRLAPPDEASVPPAEEIRFTSDDSGDETLFMDLPYW